VSNNGLSALMDVHVFDGDFLLASLALMPI